MLPSSSSTSLAAWAAWARRPTPAAASCATGELLQCVPPVCSSSGGNLGADTSSHAAQARWRCSPPSCLGTEAMPSLPTLTASSWSTCTCRRKSRGKLDLLSQKDSYHPMAEYLQYQSHGRYVSPSSKPNPYSQVRGGGGITISGCV
uniref:Mucin 1, cell surface associated n=1 Tax=Taeniopygia guttata TaxID=59729 RepID=A0A674HAK0_TAEGU